MSKIGKVIAVLCATQETEGLRRSRESLLKHGIEVFVYGLGQEWKGNGMKQVAALVAAQKFQGQFEYLLSLDGYDTICIADEDEIVDKFHSFNHPMVIAGEMNCWPDSKRASLYPPPRTNSPFRFLNGGAYLSRIAYAAAMLPEWGVSMDFQAASDQRFLTDNFLKYRGSMMIDEECSIFQCLCEISPDSFLRSGKRLINKTTFRMPCILHGNGHGNMDWYWEIAK